MKVFSPRGDMEVVVVSGSHLVDWSTFWVFSSSCDLMNCCFGFYPIGILTRPCVLQGSVRAVEKTNQVIVAGWPRGDLTPVRVLIWDFTTLVCTLRSYLSSTRAVGYHSLPSTLPASKLSAYILPFAKSGITVPHDSQICMRREQSNGSAMAEVGTFCKTSSGEFHLRK